MWVYVYNTSASASSFNGDPTLGGLGGLVGTNAPTANYVPITDAAFGGWVGVSSLGNNGWYSLEIPQNTIFACAAIGYNTVYLYTYGYTTMFIGMQPTGSK
jgi:hypothetical protein